MKEGREYDVSRPGQERLQELSELSRVVDSGGVVPITPINA
jgi:hypothetical protein